MTDIIFADTETLGLDPYAPIWEFAAIRRDGDTGVETEHHFFISHDPNNRHLKSLPEQFRADYDERYNPYTALTPYEASHEIAKVFYRKHGQPLPSLVGAVPSFDAERLARQFLEPLGIERPWHYHLLDIENIVTGFLAAKRKLDPPPWKSDKLSAAIGVDPADYPRHTAMGDVRWTMAQWDAVFGA